MKKIFIIAVMMVFSASFAQAQIKGYTKSIEAGYQMQLNNKAEAGRDYNKDVDAFNLMFMNGYRFSPYFFLGGGVGVDYSIWQDYNTLLTDPVVDHHQWSIPVLGRAKVNFVDGTVSPYIVADFGYNFLVDSDYKDHKNAQSYKRSGILLNPAVGVDFNFNCWTAIYIQVGYNWLFEGKTDYQAKTDIQSLTFKLGVKF